MTIQFVRRFASARAAALLVGAMAAGPAMATVEMRVEARPISDPIQAFVNVTDSNGNQIAGLTSADFTVTLDGSIVALAPTDVTLPPAQDPTLKVSVVFAMDYSASVTNCCLADMQQAVIAYANSMEIGDYAAIVKYNATNSAGASVVFPFTQIDQGANNLALAAAVMADYPGNGTNLFDALDLSINQFITPLVPLPAGPKAVIVISDGGDSGSTATEADVIALSSANSIPLFLIGVGDFQLPGRTTLLTELGTESGGEFIPAPTATEIADAYATLSAQLSNEYVISVPSGISDCAVHTLVVAVANQVTPASVQFTRRVCDTEPDPFTFTSQTGVAVNSGVTSNTVTITGIEPGVPADISTQIGTYSIGCNGTFTGAPGTISNGQTVCVRHTSSSAPSTMNTTTLTIGGIAGSFTSTTRAASGGGGGGGGGGGATGGVELLLGLAALFARRRRLA